MSTVNLTKLVSPGLIKNDYDYNDRDTEFDRWLDNQPQCYDDDDTESEIDYPDEPSDDEESECWSDADQYSEQEYDEDDDWY